MAKCSMIMLHSKNIFLCLVVRVFLIVHSMTLISLCVNPIAREKIFIGLVSINGLMVAEGFIRVCKPNLKGKEGKW